MDAEAERKLADHGYIAINIGTAYNAIAALYPEAGK